MRQLCKKCGSFSLVEYKRTPFRIFVKCEKCGWHTARTNWEGCKFLTERERRIEDMKEIRKDLMALCEDNEEMKKAIGDYFDRKEV
jgi:ribosomal protein L37AE/L43A